MEMTLEDLNLFPHPCGFQHREYFPNGYGLSLLPEADGETYEMAVLTHVNGAKAHLTYDSPVTDDVLRRQTREEVWAARAEVMALPSRVLSVGASG